jgi:hypothetical protein
MVLREITRPYTMKRLQHYPLLIRIILPPPLRDPKFMATLDDTFAAVFEGFDKIETDCAVNYLHERAEIERTGESGPSSHLWQLLYAWTSERKGVKPENNLLWEKSFSGTVHCEAVTATIYQEGTEIKKGKQRSEKTGTEKCTEDAQFERVLSPNNEKMEKKEDKEKELERERERERDFKVLAKNIAVSCPHSFCNSCQSKSLQDGRPQIGTSKRRCFGCISYIDRLRNDTSWLFLDGEHGKCYPWSIFQDCRPEVRHKILNLRYAMGHILRGCLKGGSDSGAELEIMEMIKRLTSRDWKDILYSEESGAWSKTSPTHPLMHSKHAGPSVTTEPIQSPPKTLEPPRSDAEEEGWTKVERRKKGKGKREKKVGTRSAGGVATCEKSVRIRSTGGVPTWADIVRRGMCASTSS